MKKRFLKLLITVLTFLTQNSIVNCMEDQKLYDLTFKKMNTLKTESSYAYLSAAAFNCLFDLCEGKDIQLPYFSKYILIEQGLINTDGTVPQIVRTVMRNNYIKYSGTIIHFSELYEQISEDEELFQSNNEHANNKSLVIYRNPNKDRK